MSSKKKAIIVDIDGTISNLSHRLHMFKGENVDWGAVNDASMQDAVHEWCRTIVQLFHKSHHEIVFLTARNEQYEKITREWLDSHLEGVAYQLLMRSSDDERPDWEVKAELYDSHIAPRYEVLFCLEDRTSVARMWRDKGLICLHCSDDLY